MNTGWAIPIIWLAWILPIGIYKANLELNRTWARVWRILWHNHGWLLMKALFARAIMNQLLLQAMRDERT